LASLDQQGREGWGAKVTDRLARDLKVAFPEVKGFSRRNLKYMRRFAEAWPDGEFVQQVLHKLPWFHLCTLLDKLKDRLGETGTCRRRSYATGRAA